MTFKNRAHKAFVVSALASALVFACIPAVHAEVKVGFVNVAKVLDKAPQAESARARIENEFAPKDRELLAQQKEIRNVEDRLIKNAAVMSASERTRQEGEIRALKRELRRSQDEFREDLNLRRSEELSKLQRKVTEVIQTLAKAEKYDLIVTDGVVFASAKVDVTDVVIDLLATEIQSGN